MFSWIAKLVRYCDGDRRNNEPSVWASFVGRSEAANQSSIPGHVSKSATLSIDYWCDREVRLPLPITTPLMSRIKCIRPCVAIQFTMCSFNEVYVQSVRMAKSSDSNAIARSGEGFTVWNVPEQLLRDVVNKELADGDSRIRRAMYGVWKRSTEEESNNSAFDLTSEEPPLSRYRRIATELGLPSTKNLSEDQLLSFIQNENSRRERATQVLTHGVEKVSEVDAWENLANQNAWMLVVYKRGKSIHAYVVRINGAIISDRGKVSIETEIGKIERGGGTWVGLGRYCCIPLANILWREIVREIQVEEVALFRQHESRVVAMKSRFN